MGTNSHRYADLSAPRWDCRIGTPEEDHDWQYVGGDPSVGIGDGWVCQACGKVDESDREPPSEY